MQCRGSWELFVECLCGLSPTLHRALPSDRESPFLNGRNNCWFGLVPLPPRLGDVDREEKRKEGSYSDHAVDAKGLNNGAEYSAQNVLTPRHCYCTKKSSINFLFSCMLRTYPACSKLFNKSFLLAFFPLVLNYMVLHLFSVALPQQPNRISFFG